MAAVAGISQPAFCSAMAQVLEALCRRTCQHIHFPGREPIPQTKQDLYNMSNFPNVIGAIDCSLLIFHITHHTRSMFSETENTHIPLMHRFCAIQNKSLQILLQSTMVHVTKAVFSEIAQSRES